MTVLLRSSMTGLSCLGEGAFCVGIGGGVGSRGGEGRFEGSAGGIIGCSGSRGLTISPASISPVTFVFLVM